MSFLKLSVVKRDSDQRKKVKLEFKAQLFLRSLTYISSKSFSFAFYYPSAITLYIAVIQQKTTNHYTVLK